MGRSLGKAFTICCRWNEDLLSIHPSIHLLIHPLIPDRVVWAAAQAQSPQPSLSSVMLGNLRLGDPRAPPRSQWEIISLPGPGPSLRSPSRTGQEHLSRMTYWWSPSRVPGPAPLTPFCTQWEINSEFLLDDSASPYVSVLLSVTLSFCVMTPHSRPHDWKLCFLTQLRLHHNVAVQWLQHLLLQFSNRHYLPSFEPWLYGDLSAQRCLGAMFQKPCTLGRVFQGHTMYGLSKP